MQALPTTSMPQIPGGMRHVLSSFTENREPRSSRPGFHAAPAIRFGDDRAVLPTGEGEPGL